MSTTDTETETFTTYSVYATATESGKRRWFGTFYSREEAENYAAITLQYSEGNVTGPAEIVETETMPEDDTGDWSDRDGTPSGTDRLTWQHTAPLDTLVGMMNHQAVNLDDDADADTLFEGAARLEHIGEILRMIAAKNSPLTRAGMQAIAAEALKIRPYAR